MARRFAAISSDGVLLMPRLAASCDAVISSIVKCADRLATTIHTLYQWGVYVTDYAPPRLLVIYSDFTEILTAGELCSAGKV
jgi:hypothetical protein